MAVAKGQDASAEKIFELAAGGFVELAMPEVCVMETFKAWELERRRSKTLTSRLQKTINEYKRRDLAAGLNSASILGNAHVEVDKQLNSIGGRAASCLSRIAQHGSLIRLAIAWTASGALPVTLPDEPDDMILSAILADAAAAPIKPVAFVTMNRDFHTIEGKDALEAADVLLLKNSSDALGWISRPVS